jgi:hypothetical protein
LAPFSSRGNAPVVFTQSQTRAGSDPIITRNKLATSTSRTIGPSWWQLKVRLQKEEGGNYTHTKETVGYIAMAPFSGTLEWDQHELQMEVGTRQRVRHGWEPIVFQQRFNILPIFVADMQTTQGGDPAGLRYKYLSANSVTVKVEEEKSKDSEIYHAYETVGYIALERLHPAISRLRVDSAAIAPQDVMAGTEQHTFTEIVLDAVDSELDVLVSEIKLKVHTAEGASPHNVVNFRIYDGDTQLLTTNDPDAHLLDPSDPEYGVVTFTFFASGPPTTDSYVITIPAGTSKTLTVKGDVSTEATQGIYQVGPSAELGQGVVDAGLAEVIIEHSDGPVMTFDGECTDSDGGINLLEEGTVKAFIDGMGQKPFTVMTDIFVNLEMELVRKSLNL